MLYNDLVCPQYGKFKPSCTMTARREPLQRSSPDPLYQQLAAYLEGEVRGGRLKSGDRIEAEDALSARFKVSRITVRQAVSALVKKDILVRKQGKGTFVTSPAVRHDLRHLHGLVGTLFAQARDANTRLLRYELRVPPAEISQAMGLAAGETALFLSKIYLTDARPVAFAEDWLAPAVASISRAKASLISTEDMMRQVGIVVVRSDTSIRAKAAGATIARHLQISPRAPLLMLRRRAIGQDDLVKEIGRLCFCSEHYEFFFSTSDADASGRMLNIRNVEQNA